VRIKYLVKYIDITRTIKPDMETYPGDPFVQVISETHNETGDPIISKLSLGSHTGTHIDAPFHVIRNGDSIAGFPLQLSEGKALVIKSDEPLAKIKEGIEYNGIQFLIFKKSYETQQFPLITCLLAKEFKELGIELIGTDLLSIDDESTKSFLNHKNILSQKIWVVESLELSSTISGIYRYMLLPMKTSARDGSPVRALLIRK
tara:strand:- start:676 stop:1284 length:609 start_codon:yes stop_codon:yes gene_type:complete